MIDDPSPPASPASPASRSSRSSVQARRRRRPVWTVLVPVVTAAAGVMFAMSFQAAQGSDLRPDRDLPQVIIAGDARVAQLSAQLDVVQKQVDAVSKANAPTDQRLAGLTKRAEALSGPAAMSAISGPGLQVSLEDSDLSLDQLPEGFTGDDVVVHQQDVQAVVNALWGAGAEGMTVQDQRIISTSAVRCVGNTLILQGRVYSPPYVIRAIGDVNRMQRALEADPSVAIYRQYVDAVGLGYDVQTTGTITLPGYSGAVDLARATPIR